MCTCVSKIQESRCTSAFLIEHKMYFVLKKFFDESTKRSDKFKDGGMKIKSFIIPLLQFLQWHMLTIIHEAKKVMLA